MSERIEIADVRDFLRVPPEKLEHCLEDFRGWLAVAHTCEAIAVGLGEPGKAGVKFGPFVWVDDGKHSATITITEAP